MKFAVSCCLGALGFAALVGSCRKQAAPAPEKVTALLVSRLPSAPGDPLWSRAPVYAAELLLQDLVEPRRLERTTERLSVRALTDGRLVAFRLNWDDPTEDSRAAGPSQFADACAVQFPARIETTVPAPQMGEAGKPVVIAYWNAAWQRSAEKKTETLRDYYPNAAVDHYPFEAPSLREGSPERKAMAKRYSPARAVENPVSGRPARCVQDLLAEGPGTLTIRSEQVSTGSGVRSDGGWSVVIVTPLPERVHSSAPLQVAFAVWDGGRGERGSRKMRTAWIPLALGGIKQ